MSTVQRLFNDFPQISIVGVVEIIATVLSCKRREREQTVTKKKTISAAGRAVLPIKESGLRNAHAIKSKRDGK